MILFIAGLTACGGITSNSSSGQTSSTGPILSGPFAQGFRMGVLGDSISRGYDITQLTYESLQDSWATGTSLSDSQINKFTSLFASYGWVTPISGYNYAVVGNTVLNSSLLSQAQQLAALSPDYVAIEIGANDVCQGLLAPSGASTSFKNEIESVLNALKAAPTPPRLISIGSIPNIWALTQIPSYASNSGCQSFWSYVCPNLSSGQSVFQAQWSAANQALEQAATAAGASVAYDGGAIANTSFSASDVSAVDCFHPSITGQSMISEAVWAAAVQPHLGVFTVP